MVQLLAAAEALRTRRAISLAARDRNAQERAITTGRERLDDATFAVAWAEGAALTLEQAIALATDDGAG